MGPSSLVLVLVSMTTTWYLGATQDLEPVNLDNLDPDAAHVCQKTTQETYTSIESFTQYYTAKTNTWCLALPPRCTKYHILSHLAYRVKQNIRQRKEYYCCTGYKAKPNLTYCVPQCTNDCYESNAQGTCVLPGQCVCNEGYRGNSCESSCDDGTWGQNCTQQCSCSVFGSCNPENGNCICHIGYTGQDCSTPCQDSFGLNCVHPCVCENNSTCNNINGKCTCQPPYYGAYCHKVCEIGTPETECQQICQCQNGGTCDANNNCVCPPGYTGEYCSEQCDSLHYGYNCSSLCSCYSGTCDHVTGQCSCYIGFAGDSCERQCDLGYYGHDCGIQCPCKNGGQCYYGLTGMMECNCAGTGYDGPLCTDRVCKTTEYVLPGSADTCIPCQCPWASTDSCNAKTGVCDCAPGFRGSFCDETCSKPFWGKNCLSLCQYDHCDCDIFIGECIACHPGFTGPQCEQPCTPDKWGPNCTFDCLCENGAKCHATTGYCNCTAGFYGLTCQDFCPENRYGPSCVNECTCNQETAICNPYTGQCQCKSGYAGPQCQDLCEDWKYGFHCLHDCLCNREGTETCDPHSGECICKPGWKGVTCKSQCPNSHWGVDCLQPCHCHPYGSCDQTTGGCLCYPGYQGDNCELTCDTGYYGYNCTELCPVCYEGLVCNPVTGECTKALCPPGLTGETCQQGCRYGTWGENCAQRCTSSCLQNGYCNPSNGMCTCHPGYTGTQCESVCGTGSFGHECNTTCNCVTSNTQECHHVEGCVCKSGYRGQSCENECLPGYWGPECRLQCTDICDAQNSVGCNPQSGIPCQCKGGYEGITCSYVIGTSIIQGRTGSQDDKGSGVGATIPLAVIAAILSLGIIVMVIILLRYRRREQKKDEMSVRFEQQNGTLPTTTQNGSAVGLVNPTYEAEQNSRNERRYPCLEQRASLPPPPRRQCENFDDIADQKLRVDMSPVSRRISGNYEDVDESRYTTLDSVMGGEQSTSEIGIPDWKLRDSRHSKRASNDYTFYLGNPGPQGQRSPGKSHRGSGAYSNGPYDTIRNVEARTISSPLYDRNSLIMCSSDQSHQAALNSTQNTSITSNQSPSNTDQTSSSLTSTDTPNRKESVSLESPSNQMNNLYDFPHTTVQQPQANGAVSGYITPTHEGTGYLTPCNDVNSVLHLYQNMVASDNQSAMIDSNQNKVLMTYTETETGA